eukprot:524158-Rhodomonas_salina.2
MVSSRCWREVGRKFRRVGAELKPGRREAAEAREQEAASTAAVRRTLVFILSGPLGERTRLLDAFTRYLCASFLAVVFAGAEGIVGSGEQRREVRSLPVGDRGLSWR